MKGRSRRCQPDSAAEPKAGWQPSNASRAGRRRRRSRSGSDACVVGAAAAPSWRRLTTRAPMAAVTCSAAALVGLLGVQAQDLKCHEKCAKCHLFDYNLEWHCIQCEPGYELWVDGCFLPCEEGKFRYGYECLPCPKNCAKCVGSLPHECMECRRGYTRDMRGLCLRECGWGKYPALDGESCPDCNAYCRTCIAGSEISCTSCYESYRLRVLQPRTQSGQCMWDCPSGFFRDAPTDLRCMSCSKFCTNCTSLDTCYGCENVATLYRGVCYKNSSIAEQEETNFLTYLESGAGIQWEPESSPKWEILMGTEWD
eukprot:TRINITY_DN41978_c0_g1_i1.p1 TRINITY_DN41978_c0_g1~~TRINITY_DN41978_c0_g1_i1.p1  ORF type:complete len:354 (-),score=66.03 TRINITY_DN41978_c0_g1_i1:142-1077(-)